jgi:hypothetical protein
MTHIEQTRQRVGFGLAVTMVLGLALPGPTLAEPTEVESTSTTLPAAGPSLAEPTEKGPTSATLPAAVPPPAQHGHQATIPFTKHSVTEAQRLATEEQYGVRLLGVRMTAAGHMLDFRYRVMDTTKAGRLIRPKMGLALIDQATKAEMPVPVMEKVGPLKQTRSHLFPDRTYSVLFANRGGVVKAGSKVSIQFGDLTLDNLIVE